MSQCEVLYTDSWNCCVWATWQLVIPVLAFPVATLAKWPPLLSLMITSPRPDIPQWAIAPSLLAPSPCLCGFLNHRFRDACEYTSHPHNDTEGTSQRVTQTFWLTAAGHPLTSWSKCSRLLGLLCKFGDRPAIAKPTFDQVLAFEVI